MRLISFVMYYHSFVMLIHPFVMTFVTLLPSFVLISKTQSLRYIRLIDILVLEVPAHGKGRSYV